MRTVTTQEELDAAGDEWVRVESGSFEAYGSASVTASGSARVGASGSAGVMAYGSASVGAFDSASVVAFGSASVGAFDSASVVAYGSARVEAYGSANVRASGSANVRAFDSVRVEASGSARVVAYGSARVEAFGSARVKAIDFAVVYMRGDNAKVVATETVSVIYPIYPGSVEEWAKMKGLEIKDGWLYLWKAVREDGTDFFTGQVNYLGQAEAKDWNATFRGECGLGLHLADSPHGARLFVGRENKSAFRLLQVRARIEDCRCFGGNPQYPMKLRARSCEFVREVERDYWEPMDEGE